MSANVSSELRTPSREPTVLWIGATAALIALWFVVYWRLPEFSEWAAARLPVAPGSHLE